jgi:hypothetical protein
MTIAHRIHTLLHEKWSYQTAAALYSEIGKSEIDKYLFSLGENSLNSERLRASLEKLACDYPFQLQRRTALPDNMPSHVVELEQEWKTLYKTANHVRGELFKRDALGNLVHSESKRAEMAHRVLACFDEINRLWGAVDYFREHGHIPPAFQPHTLTETDPTLLMRRLLNLRSYISRAEKGKKYRMSIEQMRTEAAQIERRLNP